MQGRLSPQHQNRIQTFPANSWEQELRDCKKLEIELVEWTIDEIFFEQNPILSKVGVNKINEVLSELELKVPSLTCDYFMENPFWGKEGDKTYGRLKMIIEGMIEIKSRILVIPLVDNASLKNTNNNQVKMFQKLIHDYEQEDIVIVFETDLDPRTSKEFISEFDPIQFGINYDIGNSASLGYDVNDEFKAYGERIINVHVKDREFKGSTVPLGEGAADFEAVVRNLKTVGYQGNYILQTARAKDGAHDEAIKKYRRFWIEQLSK
jgi:hexulose-6-phosphate isomerase